MFDVFDTIPTLDRQTDRRTELVKQYRALHCMRCMLTRDKNETERF